MEKALQAAQSAREAEVPSWDKIDGTAWFSLEIFSCYLLPEVIFPVYFAGNLGEYPESKPG